MAFKRGCRGAARQQRIRQRLAYTASTQQESGLFVADQVLPGWLARFRRTLRIEMSIWRWKVDKVDGVRVE
jgi:hypothetical protein